ncbi:MAG: aminotransferase class I/II-fold pyridoxal phosphate-dependent enzyme [Opitutales bacterium]
MSATASQFVANHVKDLPRSGIRDFFAVVSEMPEAISLGIGEPDFVTPWHVREAAIFALEKGRTSYTDNRGLLRLRKAISAYLEKEFNIQYDPGDETLVTVGVSEALDLALRAIINPGDKVLYHQPCYVSYHPSITLVHGEAIGVATSAEKDFCLDPAALEAAWEPGCKALILNFPTNPTGGISERATLERIARFAVDKDLLVISDEIYAELTFSGEHTSIASLPGMKDRVIFLHGFSKAFAMTGFRIGYACGPAHLIEAMMKVHQYTMMCAPILSQEAAVEALLHGDESVARMKGQYHRRRDFVVRRFNELGLPCHSPGGSFYAFPAVSGTGLDEIKFAHRLLRENEVAVVPGSAFGDAGKGHVRASFSTSYDQLQEAMERIARYLDALNLLAERDSSHIS